MSSALSRQQARLEQLSNDMRVGWLCTAASGSNCPHSWIHAMRITLLTTCRSVILAAVVMTTGCSKNETHPDAALTPAPNSHDVSIDVRVATPLPLAKAQRQSIVGRVEAGEEVSLAFLAPGVVDSVRVDIGDTVRKGQLLASMQATDLDASVTSARQQARLAQQQLARFEELFQQRYVSLNELDTAKTNALVSDQELRRATHMQRYSQIVAPTKGIVLARHVRAGEIVSQGQQILTVAGVGDGWLVRAEVPDRDVSDLDLGDRVGISLDGLRDASLDGRIARIGGAANATSGNLVLEIRLLPPHPQLRSGMIARVSLPAKRSTGERMSVPMSALVDVEGSQATVFVVKNGRAARQSVGLGELVDGRVEITSGITTLSQVVVAGTSYLYDDAPVTQGTL